MSRPLRIKYPGSFYHLTSLRNERKKVFQSNQDREKFLSCLESGYERYEQEIYGDDKRNQDLRKVFGKIEKEGLLNVAA